MNEVNFLLLNIYCHNNGQTKPSDTSGTCLKHPLHFFLVIHGPKMMLCHSYLTLKGMINVEITGDKRS